MRIQASAPSALPIPHSRPSLGEEELQAVGWSAGEYVALLEQAGESAWGSGSRLVLDLEGVQSIDETGIALLQRWAKQTRCGGAWVLRWW